MSIPRVSHTSGSRWSTTEFRLPRPRVLVGMAIDDAFKKEDVKQPPPDPDDPRKPDSPTDLTKPSLFYVLRKTAREFQHDQCTDLAAALTYYAVLSLFPAVLVMVSLLGVF